jgi:hypothetical protein
VEMLNHTLGQIEHAFYSTFGEKNVYYDSYNYDYINRLPLSGVEEDCLWDSDHDPDLPIAIGQDYGVVFNGLTVAQRHDMELRFINSFYVKAPLWIKDVIHRFCRYYSRHRYKLIYYDFDHTGLNRHPNSEPLAFQAIQLLEANGWRVIRRSSATPLDPNEKFDIAHRVYANDPKCPEPDMMYVTINGNRCKELITSIKLSPVRKNARGLAKDKSSENSKVIPQEFATHLSDAHDFTLINEYRQPLQASGIPIAIFPGRS